jgi:hypothetical protein
MTSMENFFNWMSKTIPDEEVLVWFNVHNMNYEKIELFGDIFKSLNQTIVDTYMGESDGETKISLTPEDKENHFEWCWNTLIKNFKKEEIHIKSHGEHKEYFKQFFLDSFYNQSQENVRISIPEFLNDVFDVQKPFSKSDLDILTELYKLIEKNME